MIQVSDGSVDSESRPGRLDRLYARSGVGYLFWVLGVVFVVACVFAAFDMGVLQLYRDVGMKDFGLLLGLGELVNVVGLALGVSLFGARPIWRLAKWTTSRDGEGAEILHQIVNLPWRIVPPIALIIMALEIPAIMYFSSRTGAEVPLVVVLIAILAPNGTAAFFIYLILEYLLRPIARSAAILREADGHALPRPAVSLRKKLMFGLPIVNFMTAYVSVALAGKRDQCIGPGRQAWAALAVTLTVSLYRPPPWLARLMTRSMNW